MFKVKFRIEIYWNEENIEKVRLSLFLGHDALLTGLFGHGTGWRASENGSSDGGNAESLHGSGQALPAVVRWRRIRDDVYILYRFGDVFGCDAARRYSRGVSNKDD